MKKQWKTTTLASCVQLSSGGTPSMSKSDYWGGDIPWVSSKDMKSLRLYDTEDHITEIAVEHGAKLVPTGTILVAVRGMRLAKSLPIVEVQQPVSFNQDLKAIKCKENILSRFLLYWLISQEHELLGRCDEAAHGTKRLQTDRLLSMSIELPSLSTQLLIADILTAYDDLIDNNTRRIALLEESIHRLYQEWFVYLRFPGCDRVKVVDGVPEGWEKKTLSRLATLNYGKALKKDDRKTGTIPVYGSSGIVGYHNQALVSAPGIIVGRKGNVGSVFWASMPFYPIDTVDYIDGNESSFFLYHTLSKLTFVNTDAAVPGLNRNYAYSIELLLPSPSLIQDFESFVTPIHNQIECLRSHNQKLREARDLLLPRLMNGSLVV